MDRWNILAKDYSKEPSVNNNQEFNYNYPYIEYKKCDCTKIDFDEKFPKLEVLKLNSCELPFFFIEKQINEEKFNYFPNLELTDIIYSLTCFNNEKSVQILMNNLEIYNKFFIR